MSEPVDHARVEPDPSENPVGSLESLDGLLEEGRVEELAALVLELDLHASDVADLIEDLDDEARIAFIRALPAEMASEAITEMEEGEEAGDLLAALDPAQGAELIQELADDDAADLIQELEPHEAARILAELPQDEAVELRGLLLYDEETAGGLMTTEFLAISGHLTAEEAIREVRVRGREVEHFYNVFVIDEKHRLLGVVPLDDLIIADTEAIVADLAVEVPATVRPDLDQEEVGRLLSRYNLVSIPVLNEFGVLLGRITFDDVIDVIELEQTEDILRLAGVPDDEEVRAEWHGAVRTRLPWLALNLVTIVLTSSVVLLFDETLARYWWLAALMPIIAGMGGNSGTQALAVTIRRIAIASSELERRSDAVSKEVLIGLINGIVLGALAALLVLLASFTLPDVPRLLSLVVLIALWGNIVVAGTLGALVPTVLDRIDVDPAVASSVFLTTTTDLVGFILLLGLASAVLL
ncbi:MAG: magnesium transporter [Longimicrobiales bacterium]|nr:magnesium transporter [Longimicrobiales bacterium]